MTARPPQSGPRAATRRRTGSRTATARRLPANDELLRRAASRLTDRDRAIVRLVARHKVLTTDQLTALFFTNPPPSATACRCCGSCACSTASNHGAIVPFSKRN